MPGNKRTGSFYTPIETVDFMWRYILAAKGNVCSILEPSAGDGRFVDRFVSGGYVDRVMAVEVEEEKTEKLREKQYPPNISIESSDFLKFAESHKSLYELIIGNPPYISIKNMNKDFLENARRICSEFGLEASILQNSWVAFLLASIKLLDQNGIIFFVLPLEFLQVHYAEKLRLFLEGEFNTIHILTFSERMFPDIEQETCLVYLANEPAGLSYISYRQYASLKYSKPVLESRIERNKPLKKWSNAVLSDSQIDLFSEPGFPVLTIDEMGNSSPGIVTAANNYFILTEDEVKEYACEQYVIPVISKGAMVQNSLVIDSELINKLSETKRKIYLLNLKNEAQEDLPLELSGYLEKVGSIRRGGKTIREGYKCSKRKPWYGIPIIESGEVCFFKRYNLYPRMCLNEEMVRTTDIAYGLRLREEYDAKSLVFCFYNSMTIAQCEYSGRFYAGGVSELTPREFKSLCIPYRKISKNNFDQLNVMFQESKGISEITAFVNSVLFGDEKCEVTAKFDVIRDLLTARRIRKNKRLY